MKRGLILLINVIVISFLSESFAQNSLWLVSGKKLSIGEFKIIQNEDESIIEYFNTKGKQKKVELEDVYSVSNEKGKETIFYKKNLFGEKEITEAQFRNFVHGQYDSRLNNNEYFSLISSFPVGFASVFYPPLSKIYLFPTYPAVYAGLLGTPWKRYDKQIASDADEYYIHGYNEAAKRKRIKNSLIGSGAGVIAGVIVAIIVK